MRRLRSDSGGFTLIELLVTILLLGAVAGSMMTLFVSLVRSAVIAKRQAVGLTLATNQMEYMKTLPYNNLAIAGGSIYSPSPLPSTVYKTFNGVKYKIVSSISYVDDAYDGCGSYPTPALKLIYCRNYPPPSGAPATDTNPADYKILDVDVTDPGNNHLAQLNTQVSARVAETASTTGAMFVNVIDETGAPVSGATVTVTNATITPVANLTDSTDGNGIAIFYGLLPDTTGNDYTITSSKSSYSTLATIKPSGSLQPTYASQNILSQSSSYVTLTIKKTGVNSLVVEATDTNGTALANFRPYIKGGYKQYTAVTDTTYYYDNRTPSDVRPTTDASGLAAVTNLVPGSYVFCGDTGATNCTIGGTTYYLAAAVPYGGNNAFNPITVPTYDAANPPATTYTYGATQYLQKVRLILTTSSTFPRINTISPDDVSKTGGPSFAFTITGTNLTGSVVSFLQGASTYTASCSGSSTQQTCTVNMTAATVGSTQLRLTVGANTLTIPASLTLGGLNVTP